MNTRKLATQRNRSRWLLSRCVLFLLAGVLLGCLPPVRVKSLDPLKRVQSERARALEDSRLSKASIDTLKLLGMEREWKKNPQEIYRRLIAGEVPEHNLDDCRLLLAELALLQGRAHMNRSELEESSYWFLVATMAAWDQLSVFYADPEHRLIRDREYLETLYGHTLSRYLEVRSLAGSQQLAQSKIQFAGTEFEVDLEPCDVCWNHDYFDRVLPAESMRVKGMAKRYSQRGLGAAMVGVRENELREEFERWQPPEGIVYPVTGWIEWEPIEEGRRTAKVKLVDPRRIDALMIGNQAHVPAADFSAAYGLLLSRTELNKLGLRGLRHYDRVSDRRGVYMMEPYDPDKIPLLMIHGLVSSPATWIRLTNGINGDPMLRRHYQIWHYMYPTGATWLESARHMRAELDELRSALDPEGEHVASDEIVVIAHSMGGLLAKTLMVDSQEELWDTTFKVGLDDLDVDDTVRRHLNDSFFFERKPYVRRAIFAATPHRGAALAKGPLGKFAASLVRLPVNFVNMIQQVVTRNSQHITEEAMQVQSKGKFTSIRGLRPDYPLLVALAEIEIPADVRVHSLVGNRGKTKKSLEESSDGVVPYWSSHLDEALSERVVPSSHNVHVHPEGTGEIRRILTLHLREIGRLVLPEELERAHSETDTEESARLAPKGTK